MWAKTIRQFLLDGVADGRWICELSNWTGKAFKIPRTFISRCSDREELSHTGVYFLFGINDTTDTQQVYIGEAENIINRLKQHVAEKSFWTECVVFISKDNNLNKAHIKYLENHLYILAKKNNRYEVLNANIPTESSISEMDRAEMDEFIDNMRLILSVLGHKVLEPTISMTSFQTGQVFVLQNRSGERVAYGRLTSDGFAVFQGATVAKQTTASCPSYVLHKRKQLIEKGIINQEYQFKQDWLFTSPSLAAAVITGRSINGQTAWKNENGISLKEIENKETD